MRHLRAWAAGAIIAAILIGCGPAKELPDDIPRSTENGRGEGVDKETVPEKSDPAALEIVEQAIKAHTQNNPTRLEKGKLSRLTASGTVKLPWGEGGSRVPISATRTLAAKWPEEIKWSYEYKSHRPSTLTMILRNRFIWWGENGVEAGLTPQKLKEDMLVEGTGQHWLVLLFPLTESNVIVYDRRIATSAQASGGVGGDRKVELAVVSVSIPDRPTYRLYFSTTSKFLIKVEYHYTDMLNIPAMTEWMLSEHQDYSGLLLPKQIKMARTTEGPRFRDIVQEFTVDSWEFPDKLDESAFAAPKKGGG